MPRSVRDSDDDAESKTGRTRSQRFNIHSTVNSPLRRSSRIKQSKHSPVSPESDTSSISNSQLVRNTRSRATMDNETLRDGRTRKPSISSDINESIDVDIVETPKKRITRSYLTAGSIGTPTKINTRASSKRFIRAGSEAKSPLPVVRTRRTRASSVDPESFSEQNRSQPGTPIKTYKRHVTPGSPVKEEDEKKNLIPYVRLDATIVETEELTNSGNSDSSSEKALRFQQSQRINKKSQSIHSEVEEDTHESEQVLRLSEEKDEIHEHTDKITKDNETILAGKRKSEENSSSSTTDEMQNNSNLLSSAKEEDKLEIIKNSPGKEKSVKYSKELMIKIENFMNPMEQKESPGNKENQTLNIISDSLESNIQAIINVTSSTKCLSPIFVNKSSNEKETKFTKNESNLDLTDKQKCSGSPSINDTTKRQSLIHEADNKSTTNDTNESILLQHEDVEVIDEATVKDKTPIKQISKSIENTIEDIAESDEVVSKNFNKIELNKSPNSSKIQSKIEQESDNTKNSKSISIIDDNEIKLEEQCQDQDQNKSPSVDLVGTSSVNKDSNDQSNPVEKQSIITQDNIDNTDFTEQEQRNSSKYAIESDLESSNAPLETFNSTSNASNEDNAEIQDVLLSPILTESSEKFPTNMSSKKTETKSTLKNIAKQDLTQKNTDNIHDQLEKEKEDLQLKNQEDTNTNIDPDVSVFHANPSDNFNEKEIEEEMDVEISSVHSNSQLLKENESETECDLVLVDKKAWLAAENIKAAKEAESFEYDSDDTVLLKSRSDVRTTNYEQLLTINEDSSSENQDAKMKERNRDKKSLIMIEEEESDKEASNSFRKKHMLEKCKDSSLSCTEDESDDFIANVDKSVNEFKAILNQSNDRSVSKLNKSGQIVKAMKQSFETDDESDEIEDDSNRSNRSLRVNEKNKSLSESMERRKSLNKSSTKDIPSRQEDKVVQNISLNKSQKEYSRKGLDDTLYLEKKVQDSEKKSQKKKRSLNKSQDTDENTSKSEEKNLPNVETSNDDESDKDEVVIPVMKFAKNYSIIASNGSNSDEKSDSSDEDSYIPAIPLETHSNDSDSNSDVNSLINSDIEKEYNLNGGEQKFSDDNVPADECRASESEASDPDDDGSDLASFIVDDDEVIEEEEEEEEADDNDDDDDDDDNIFHDDEEKEESNNEEENVKNMKEAEEEKEEVDVESIDEQSTKEKNKVAKKKKIKNKRNEQDMDIEKEEVDVEGIDEQNIKEKNKVAKKKKKNKSNQQDMDAEKEEVDVEGIDEQNVKEKNKVAKQKRIKNKNNEQDVENVENKAEENVILDEEEGDTEGNSIKCIPSNTKMLSPEVKSTKIKRDFKKKKSDMENKTILLDTSHSDSSITQKNEDIVLLDTPNLSAKKKKRSNVQFFPENVTEQDLMEQSNKSEKIRKLPKSHKFIGCSTPKLDTQKFEFTETPETAMRISEIKDIKTDDTKTTQTDTSFKKKKSKRDSILRENVSLREFNPTTDEKKRLNRSLPSDLLEAIEKAGLSKPVHSKMSDLRKTMNITHTESPTIRYLRKEKLNESAPALSMELYSREKKPSSAKKVKDIAQTRTKLENDEEASTSALNVELDSGEKKVSSAKKVKNIAQTRTKLENDEEASTSALNVELDSGEKKVSSAKKVKDIAQAKTKLETAKEEILNLIISSGDDGIQKRRKKQKKRKARTEDISSENIPDEALTQDVMESDVPKKKKRIKLAQEIVEDDSRDNQTDEKEKKRKKKQLNVIERNENVNEEDVLQKNIRKNKTESMRRKRKNYEIVDSSDLNLSADVVQKKSKRQKIAESEEMVPVKLLDIKQKKKKREEKISSSQIRTSELKSTKDLGSNKLQKQNIPSDPIKSKNIAFIKARKEALEAIHAAEMRIRARNTKELKKKKRENIEKTQKQVLKIPDKKQRKEVTGKSDSLPSSSGLKRLPDDVVENLTDQPTRAKKKRSQIQQQSGPSVLSGKKSKATTAKNEGGLVASSSFGSTTEFTVVDLQKAEKQSSGSSAAASLRERMLARNNREPVSAYMMYLEKQKASSSNRFF
ncbi:myb-like protein X isoform X1 [Camponotus floridanus]|uniref:myb-like protein X isoform X1 n=2 Tax=Camponotus floridanus TaxID=104421 RepID=UPI000DC6876F|nr:myb-like protein X isoform X1 [Camponotus floridanus]